MQDELRSQQTTAPARDAHRADRARLRGAPGSLPVDPAFECRVLRDGSRTLLHAAATSHLVSTSMLEALFMTTSNPALQRLVAQNPRSPLWVIGEALHDDLDEVALAFYARRMGRPDLAYRLMEATEPGTTVAQRWQQLGGGAVPSPEIRLRAGEHPSGGGGAPA